jgi:uncharacterized membrane protein YgcG
MMLGMRTLASFAIFILGFVFVVVPTYAAETIPSFDARITVSANATIEVIEKIVYDFGTAERHGIFRTIPYSYQAGSETYTADISSVTVADERGQPQPFNESRGNGELTLKIGDPNTTVTGRRTYVITYVVDGPFLYFDDNDEFYWNVTGSWPTGIASSSVLVDLPRGAKVLAASCYQGPRGATTTCDHDERLVSSERAGYTASAGYLAPGEGLTVAVAFPKGVIATRAKPWERQATTDPWTYLPLGLPVVTFVAMFALWYTRGRDPEGRGTIVTEFEPPDDLPPSIAGVVYNERLEPRELSSEIVRLAVEGYLKIHRLETTTLLVFHTVDYLLERVETGTTPADPIGALMLENLFQTSFAGTAEVNGATVQGTLLSKMQHKFMEEKKALEERVYAETTTRKYFLARPDKVRTMYIGIGIALVVAGIIVATFGAAGQLLSYAGVGIALSGVLVALWGNWMPVKTREGVLMRERLEGFKRYLSVAEKDRITYHNAPERSPEVFEAFLPYAMAFGVEKAWAKYFEDLYTSEPEWYTGGTTGTFALGSLASDLSSFTTSVSAASAPQSSGAGGGGSSGGGFGGGGGGSW